MRASAAELSRLVGQQNCGEQLVASTAGYDLPVTAPNRLFVGNSHDWDRSCARQNWLGRCDPFAAKAAAAVTVHGYFPIDSVLVNAWTMACQSGLRMVLPPIRSAD